MNDYQQHSALPTQNVGDIVETDSMTVPTVEAGKEDSPLSSLPTDSVANIASTIKMKTLTAKACEEARANCSFPIEIMENIARRLPLKDITSLRLVCRDFEAKTFRYFTHTYFKTITTDLSIESLQDVKAISEHKHLKDVVEVLRLEEVPFWSPGQSFEWKRNTTGSLVHHNPAVKILGDVLAKNLEKCRSFSIVPFFSRYMLDTYDPSVNILSPADLFGILIEIVTEKSLIVRGLDLSVDDYRLEVEEEDKPRYQGYVSAELLTQEYSTYRQCYLLPETLSTWTGLQELSLHGEPLLCSAFWAVKLITHATGLQKLTIGFQDWDMEVVPDVFSMSVTLPKLRELNLTGGSFSLKGLKILFDLFSQSLRRLGLSRLDLEYENSWAPGFDALKNELPLLETFYFDHLKFSSSNFSPWQMIIFDALKDGQILRSQVGKKLRLFESNGHMTGVRYEGPDISEALDMVTNGISMLPLSYAYENWDCFDN